MHVINALAPVFVLVIVGHLLLRYKFAEERFFHLAAKFAYWIGLPSLLFKNISETSIELSDAWRIFVMMSIATLLVAVSGAMISRFFQLDTSRCKTFIHTCFHCNTAFVGLPVILYSVSDHPDRKMLTDMASMAIAPMIPLFNIMSIIVMRGSDNSGRRNLFLAVIRRILTNPQVLSCMAGLIVSFTSFRLPLALSRSLGSLGGMALPLALLSIGAGLSPRNVRDGLKAAMTAASFNVILLPLIGFVVCRVWGLSAGESLVGLIFLACPTASSAYIYARQLKGDPAFAGNVILISTLISAPVLWLVLSWGLG